MSQEMPSETTPAAGATTTRRTRRASTTRGGTRATTTRRRRRQGGSELVENLNAMIDQLIRENRKLKRQLDRVAKAGTTAAGQGIERGLRTIQRRVQRALDGPTTRRRRTTTATAARGTRTATRRRTTRTRRTSSS